MNHVPGAGGPGLDAVADAADRAPHFVAAMGLDMWSEGSTTYGQAAIGPELCVPGTAYPRIAVLATMVDLVAGSQPGGPVNPTVDMRIELLGRVTPSKVRLSCEVLKAARTLLVGETRLFADDDAVPFSCSMITFMNRRMEQWEKGPGKVVLPKARPRIEELLAPRFGADGSVEIDTLPRLTNGMGGTVQGGVLALLAELATERAIPPTGVVTPLTDAPLVSDLDIRYLNRVRAGPVRAVAEVLSPIGAGRSSGGPTAVQVRMTDVGDQDRLVAMASAVSRAI